MTEPLQRIREEELEALVQGVEYLRAGGTTTIALVKIKGGFSLVASSACLNPDDYDETLGRQIAYRKAFDRLWELEGYHRMRSRG